MNDCGEKESPASREAKSLAVEDILEQPPQKRPAALVGVKEKRAS
jgi:hypothetical protein